MRFTTALSTASVFLAAAEGLNFQLHRGFDYPIEAVHELSKRATTISTDFNFAPPQFSYYVDILVGSAHEFIRLRLSSDPFTWFPGPLPSRNYCARQTSINTNLCLQESFSGTFNPDGSDTFKNLTAVTSTDVLNLTYAGDSRYFATGYYGSDTLQIGQTEVANVPIGIATNYTVTPQLGLGTGGSGSTQLSLLETMVKEDVISVLSVAFYLNDYDRNNSALSIGAIDTAKYEGNLITFSSAATTVVQVLSLEYESAGRDPETLGRDWNANVEFSTGLLYLPLGPLQAITRDVEAYVDTTYGYYLTDCNYRWSDKALKFNFDGMNITIPASQWIVPFFNVSGARVSLRDGETPACIVLVFPITSYTTAVNSGYDIVLGMPFVRATYMVHDFTNRETSFAQAKFNTSDSEIKSLGTDGVRPFATLAPSPTPNPTETGPDGTGTGGATETGGTTEVPQGGSSTPVGAIAGGVIGGVAAIGLAIGAFFFLKRRQDKKMTPDDMPPPHPPMQETTAPPGAPYGGYQNQQAPFNQQGYNYEQGGYNEQYGTAPVLPNKGAEPQSPGAVSTLSPRPVSEMAGTPIDPSQRYSVAASGISEMPSPGQENAPVELPGHYHR